MWKPHKVRNGRGEKRFDDLVSGGVIGAREQALSVALRTYRTDFHSGNGLMLNLPTFQVACGMCFCVPVFPLACPYYSSVTDVSESRTAPLPVSDIHSGCVGWMERWRCVVPHSPVGIILGHFLDCAAKVSYICPS
jgi:hypothetical protein